MAWVIKRDYLDGKGSDAIGRGQGTLQGVTFAFRLRDDDSVVYYRGEADTNAALNDDEEGGLYEAYRWGTYYAGTTDLQIPARDGWRFGLVDQRLHTNPDEWVSIYG